MVRSNRSRRSYGTASKSATSSDSLFSGLTPGPLVPPKLALDIAFGVVPICLLESEQLIVDFLVTLVLQALHSTCGQHVWRVAPRPIQHANNSAMLHGVKPPESSLTIPAELHRAVMELAPEDRWARAPVNQAAARVLDPER